MKCRKCGSENLATRQNDSNRIAFPNAYDLYCCECGAWQKFATKEERRIYNGERSKSSIICPCCGYPITIEVNVK